MKTVPFLLCLLGTAVAIPTNARFLPDHSKSTAEPLVMPDNKEIPIVSADAADNEKETTGSKENHPNHKAEQSSTLRSEEGTHELSAEQDKTQSHELGLKEQDGDDELSVNLEYSTTEGNLEPQEDTGEPQKKKLQEDTDFSASNVSSLVDSNQQENITKGEEYQEQPGNDSHLQLDKNSTQSQDLREEESQEQDANIPNGKEEEETEPGNSDTPTDNPDKEKEFPEDHSNSKQEDNEQPDDILEEANQPTQVSKMQEDELEQGSQEKEEDNSNVGLEEDSASNISEHTPDTERQSQEGKMGLKAIGDHKDIDKKTVSEALLLDPTDVNHVTPRNHGADADNDDSKHSAGDDYFVPSQDFTEAEKAQSISYHLKYEEERDRAHKNENVDASEPADHQEDKKAQSSSNEEEASSEGHMRVHGTDSCVNFQCKRGHVCKAEPQGTPHCVCQDPETCPPAKPLDQACGTDNQTYASSCHLFATKCRLEGTKKGHQLQLDYFGACKSIPVCTDFEVAQFPLRMRDWLKNILMQLYEPNPKHAGYLNEKQRSKVKKIYLDEKRLLAGDHPIELLLRDFKKNYHMYVYPVHWQFSELDRHPMDRVLTHSELAPLRASLVPMEHCITRFFEECDPNKDKHITLKEWGHCFGIKEEDIDENLLF